MQLTEVPLSEIFPDPDQPRKDFVNIPELADAIQKEGLISPLEVLKQGKKYLILDGERRYHALKRLNYTHVPCVVQTEVQNKTVRQLITDFHKEKLNPVEQCDAINTLIQQGFIKKEIIKLLGIGKSTLDRILRVNTLSPYTKEKILNKELPEFAVRKILHSKDAVDDERIARGVIKDQIQNRRSVESLIEKEGNFNVITELLTDTYKYLQKLKLASSRIVDLRLKVEAYHRENFAVLLQGNDEKIKRILADLEVLEGLRDRLKYTLETQENVKQKMSPL